ncbi:preprotein translocase subunit YajC [Caldicellulosiruptoraceae bacterium PP1]
MGFLFDLVYASTNSAQNQPASGSVAAALITQFILPIVLMFVLFYVMLIVPQRRRDKQFREMLNSLIVGDEVVTTGGIIGKIVSIKDDTITIEVGADKVKLKVYKWAVKEVTKKAEPK